MNNVDVGLKFENKAKDILKKEGYKIIEHTSQESKIAPYDLIGLKNNKVFYIEVKGRRGDSKNFSIHSGQLKSYIYFDNVLILLINDYEYRLIKLEDLENNKLLRGFYISLGLDLSTLKYLRKNFIERVEREKKLEGHQNYIRKKLFRLGDKLIVIFEKWEQDVYGMCDGDCIDVADMLIQKTKKRKREKK